MRFLKTPVAVNSSRERQGCLAVLFHGLFLSLLMNTQSWVRILPCCLFWGALGSPAFPAELTRGHFNLLWGTSQPFFFVREEPRPAGDTLERQYWIYLPQSGGQASKRTKSTGGKGQAVPQTPPNTGGLPRRGVRPHQALAVGRSEGTPPAKNKWT